MKPTPTSTAIAHIRAIMETNKEFVTLINASIEERALWTRAKQSNERTIKRMRDKYEISDSELDAE